MEQQAAQMNQQQAAMQAQHAAEVLQLNNNVNHWHHAAGVAEAAAAAAAAPAEEPPEHNMPRGYRPEGPPKYHGRVGEDVEAWLFQVEESNRLFPIRDGTKRVRYIALYLRDTAAEWYSAMQMKDPPQITGWDSFVTKLREQFKHMDQEFIARNAIHGIKQTHSAREYSVKFRGLQNLIPDMSPPDALDKYIRGLKDFAWKVWRKKFTTIEEAIVYAEELDLEIQQKHVLNKGSTPSSTTTSGKPHRPPQHSYPAAIPSRPWQPRHEARNFDRGGPTPMVLGVMRMTETERTRHMLQDLCFHCHKTGHRANVCPSKSRSGNGVGRR